MNGENGIMECEMKTETSSTVAGYVEEKNEISPIRIWLVDDNASFRGLLMGMLNSEVGLECYRQFPSPAAVLRALADEAPPDVILLDIEMGAYNGLDAIGPIKSLVPGTHVLMLTAFSTPGVRARAFREGASDFMLKSWLFDDITAHIRQAMEFGSAAGLLTAYLGKETPSTEPEPVPIAQKPTVLERWLIHLRGLLKFSPS